MTLKPGILTGEFLPEHPLGSCLMTGHVLYAEPPKTCSKKYDLEGSMNAIEIVIKMEIDAIDF